MKTIWITGASSGIGEALAYKWSEQGHRLILSARRLEELERVKSRCANPGLCTIVCLDLSDEQSLIVAANKVLNDFQTVDILVHNGGISQRSFVIETPIEIDRKIMEVDFFSGVLLSKKILPRMLEHGRGHIVCISSIVGLFGFPMRSAYSAAKHAIHGFYESLWAELHPQGIDVTVVCPGRILTNISLHALTKDGKEHGVMDHAQANGISAEECAQRIVKAVEKKKKELYIGKMDLLMIYFKRYLPWLYYKMVTRVKPK